MTDEALLYVINQRMPQELSIIGIMLATLVASDHRGVQITVDWPEFLGCTEDGILADLTDWYRRQARDLGSRVKDCPDALCQDLGSLMRVFAASDGAEASLRQLAADRWARRAAQERTTRS